MARADCLITYITLLRPEDNQQGEKTRKALAMEHFADEDSFGHVKCDVNDSVYDWQAEGILCPWLFQWANADNPKVAHMKRAIGKANMAL